MATPAMTLGLRIVVARRSKGLTLRDLEDMTGIPNSALSRYEHDHSQPTLERLVILADALGVTPNYLLGYDSGATDTPGSLNPSNRRAA